VSARYHAEDNDTDQILAWFPLTAQGRQQAIDYARHMCSEESRSQRNQLYDAYWTGGVDFDAVVTEVRSIVRRVHLEKALDDDGQPLID